jgi:hypothetical protein
VKSVCSNCDLKLKKSNCSDIEYVECECRRWITEQINNTNLHSFMCLLDETLESIYENPNDLRRNKLRIIEFLTKGLIE